MLPLRGDMLSKTCLRAAQRCRTYARSAAAVPLSEPLESATANRPSAPREQQEVQVTQLANGIRVASLENHSNVSDVSVYVNAGARYESPSNTGITHVLRNAAFLTNKSRTGFRTTREIQQDGSSLSATSSREHFVYSASCLRGKLSTALDNIACHLQEPLFNPWELEEAYELTQLDKAHLGVTPQALVLDNVHAAAFRNGLGNSLYCPEDKIGKFSSEELQHFAANYFVGANVTLVGLGVNHSELVDQANSFFGSMPKGTASVKTQQNYHGGEIRERTGGAFVHAAVVAQGASLGSKESLALGVLQKALGGAPYLKYGSNTVSSRLNRSAHGVCPGPLMVSSLNLSYSDNGLFGFYAVCQPKYINEVLKSAVGQFSQIAKSGINDEELQRAKNQFKSSILMASESSQELKEDIAKQVIFKNGNYIKPLDAVAEVDKITKEEVSNIAKRMLSVKASMSVSGETANAPYVDQLF